MPTSHDKAITIDGDAGCELDLLGILAGPATESGAMPDGLSIEWLMDRLTKTGDDA